MSYACSRNVVHRDLKPENIMVGDFGKVYIVDWGLAKIFKSEEEPEETIADDKEKFLEKVSRIHSFRSDQNLDLSMNNEVIVGTPHYMAPERFTGFADERTEVFALGAILYNILTLSLTVKGDSIEKIVEVIVEDKIIPPDKIKDQPAHLPQGKVPSPLSAIAMKSLAPHRMDRYSSIAELKKDVKAWQEGFATNAEEASFLVVMWRAILRNKKESIAVFLFAIICLFLFTFYIINTNNERDRLLAAKSISEKNKEQIDRHTAEFQENSRLIVKKAEQLKGLSPEFSINALSLLNQNKTQEALEQINIAISLDNLPEHKLLKAYIHLLLNQIKEATIGFNKLTVIPHLKEECIKAAELCSLFDHVHSTD